MFNNLVTMIQLAASLYVTLAALAVLNRMTKSTAHGIFAAYLALAGAGFVGVLTCKTPDLRLALFALGVALFFLFNRRPHGDPA